jgi:hypothetical protein
MQEMFGFAASPTVAGVPLCLSLLSPAGRPVLVLRPVLTGGQC